MVVEWDVIKGLQKINFTEEEVSITIVKTSRERILEECSLSLFGKFLTTIPFNRRAARDTMRMAWHMGSDLKILEVRDDILQFIFPIEFQMQWVLNNEPWSFENHLLLLRRWERGLRTRKPLRNGGFVPCLEGERVWINYRYEHLLAFCYKCGRLGHDEKACVNHCLGGEDGSA
jgi:hypothetical protein